MELSCFPEAGGLDSFLLGFWGVEWDKLLICYEVMPIEFGKQGRDKSGMGLGGGRRRRFVNQQRVTSNEVRTGKGKSEMRGSLHYAALRSR